MQNYLILNKGALTFYLPVKGILYIEAAQNKSIVVLQDGRRIEVSFQLGVIYGQITLQLGKSSRLLRVGKSLIVNVQYVHLIDMTEQTLVLSDCIDKDFYYVLNPSREALVELEISMNEMIVNGLL